jgi:hypothetical protein
VTFNASHVVVGWSKTVLDSFTFGENEFVVFKPAIAARGWRLWFVYTFVDRHTFHAKTVEEIIGLRVHVGRECFGGGLTLDGLR